ncbi:MAG: hypothetical protein JO257_01410 [Deltaproteobacteria bacterium]|nr:hypothetical protein [Deltaproteobacteria bacterium]
MRASSLLALCAILVTFRYAHADGRGDVEKKIKEAMEQYDLMDYDAAKKLLNQALQTAKKSKLDKDGVSAKAYLDLGIVDFVNGDQAGAKDAFATAASIDPKIQIDPAYKTADMAKLLDSARSGASAGGGGDTGGGDIGGPPAADCSSVKGLQHEIIDTAKGGSSLKIEALVGSDVKPVKVSIKYRPEGATDFAEVKMSASGCKYTGSIPASAFKGSLVHYYVAAYNDAGKPIAAKGSEGSPNIIEVTAPAPGSKSAPSDDEDPISGKKVVASSGGGSSGGDTSSGGEVTSSVTVGPKKQKVYLAVAGGTGFGYVSGTTEGMNPVKSCCIGSSLVVLQPEIGFFVSSKLAVGVAGRIGIPMGANLDGHATAAPGVLLRVRYALSPTGQGVRIMGQAGAGVLRNTIKLDNAMTGMDTDIVAQGPVLIGAGVGYTKALSGNISFLADFSALAAIATTSQAFASPKLNTGFGADLSLGLALGF